MVIPGTKQGTTLLRIDNSRQSAICAFGGVLETMVITRTCHISNKRAHFSLFYDINERGARV